MSNYSTKLRQERREELALRALSFATKTEDGKAFPSSDYAYVPDPDMPSTWKLRLTSTPGGDPDPHIVGAAVAALGKGFRGNKVEIPSSELSAVKAKVKSAWKKANPDKSEDEMPSALSSYTYEIEVGDMEFGSLPPFLKAGIIKGLEKKLSAEKDDKKKAEIQAKIDKLKGDSPAVTACGDMMSHGQDDKPELGYGSVEGPDRAFLEALLPYHTQILDLISKTNFEDDDVAEYAAEIAEKLIKGAAGIRTKLKATVDVPDVVSTEAPVPAIEAKKYMYSIEISDLEFGGLPPFLKAGMIKNLEKKLAAETDDAKKAKIQAQIDKLKGNDKKVAMAAKVDSFLDEESEEFAKKYSFEEAKHQRSPDGKFSKGSGGGPKMKISGPATEKPGLKTSTTTQSEGDANNEVKRLDGEISQQEGDMKGLDDQIKKLDEDFKREMAKTNKADWSEPPYKIENRKHALEMEKNKIYAHYVSKVNERNFYKDAIKNHKTVSKTTIEYPKSAPKSESKSAPKPSPSGQRKPSMI